MHRLVVAITNLPIDDRRDIDRYLLVSGAYIRSITRQVAELRRRSKWKEIDGTEMFLLLERQARAKRKFRKIVRQLMRREPLGTLTPAGDPAWDFAARKLARLARIKMGLTESAKRRRKRSGR